MTQIFAIIALVVFRVLVIASMSEPGVPSVGTTPLFSIVAIQSTGIFQAANRKEPSCLRR